MDLNWKKLLNIEDMEVMGLDIGSSSVRAVQMRKDEAGYVVTAAGITDIANAIEATQEEKEMNTINAIGECIGSAGIETKLAVCGVCGPEVAVRYFTFPVLPPEEMQGAVLLEAAQVCPFNIDDSVVDYQLMPDGEDNTCGVLVAATKKLIERKRNVAGQASLDCVLMDVDGLALLNCFREYEKFETGKTIALLNVGSTYTTLAIMGANSSPFIRDIDYAGRAIIQEIASKKKLSAEEVRKALVGGDGSAEINTALNESLEKTCRKLITDVTETLRYYTTQEKSAVIEKIFVCGFAKVRGFVELLNSRLPAETILWNPFDKIPCDAGQGCRNVLEENGPAMAVAAGLAMRSI